jgi:thiol-disulfide isomerase/thioredoxin
MRRRHWIIGGAASAALAAGVALQQRRNANVPQTPPTEPGSGEANFWQMRFEQPDGQVLDMAGWRGRPLLLNFWGTWCPPCIKEMPELDLFAKRFAAKGWRVLGLAVDNPQAVRDFLARSPVSYTIGLAGFEGSSLSQRLGNTQAGLPFTVAFDRQGEIRHHKAGATTLEELARWAEAP